MCTAYDSVNRMSKNSQIQLFRKQVEDIINEIKIRHIVKLNTWQYFTVDLTLKVEQI